MYIVPGVGLVKQVEYAGNFNHGQSAPGIARTIELVQAGTSPEESAKKIQSEPVPMREAKAEALSSDAKGTGRRVASLGTVVEVGASTFILKQESLRVSPGRETIISSVRYELPLGYVNNHLEVLTDNRTEIVIAGNHTLLSALKPGTRVMVAGMAESESLRAVIISDFKSGGPPLLTYA